MGTFKLFAYTCLALFAFAGNSILCRLALAQSQIDATSFTLIRLVSGAVTLWFLLKISKRHPPTIFTQGSWKGASALFVYAAAFSYAYIELDAGLGALVLFTCVQVTMIASALISGHRFSIMEWLGTAFAFVGFVYLVSPGAQSPHPQGVLLMAVAGVAWGAYSILGKQANSPLADTAGNFTKACIVALVLLPVLLLHSHISLSGGIYAALSGAITSGCGYAIWYRVLPHLQPSTAAVSQLSVPVIAILAGWLFLSEQMSVMLAIASLLILGGIILVIKGKARV